MWPKYSACCAYFTLYICCVRLRFRLYKQLLSTCTKAKKWRPVPIRLTHTLPVSISKHKASYHGREWDVIKLIEIKRSVDQCREMTQVRQNATEQAYRTLAPVFTCIVCRCVVSHDSEPVADLPTHPLISGNMGQNRHSTFCAYKKLH